MDERQAGKRNGRRAEDTGHQLLIAALWKFLKGPVPHDQPWQPEDCEGAEGKEETGS